MDSARALLIGGGMWQARLDAAKDEIKGKCPKVEVTTVLPVPCVSALYSLFVAHRFYIVYRQSPAGPVDLSFRALSGRLNFTVRRHMSETYF